MKILIFVLTILVLALIQVTVLPHLSIYQGIPNLILLGSIILIFLEAEDWAYVFAAIGGITLDILSSNIFGIFTFGFLAITWGLIFLNRRIIESTNLLLILFLTLISSLVFDFWFLTISRLAGKIPTILIFSRIVGIDALFNVFVMLLIFPFIFGFWKNYYHRSEIKL